MAVAVAGEIASKLIACEKKKVFVDLQENARGKFLKISEQDAGGNRAKIIVPVSGAARFRDILTSLAEVDASLGPVTAPPADTLPNARVPPLRSESLRAENKQFYFDLRQNARGRFLKISQVLGVRSTIVVPAPGINLLREAIEEVCRGDPVANAGLAPIMTIPQEQLPVAAQVSSEQKRFFFDIGSNQRGVFMRVSEVVGPYRTCITIPQSAWSQVRDTIGSYIDNVEKLGADAQQVSVMQ